MMSPSRAATRAQKIEQDRLRHFVGEHRERALRQHDEAAAARVHELGVELERARAEFRIELHVLRHVALHERHRDRLADRRRPREKSEHQRLPRRSRRPCRAMRWRGAALPPRTHRSPAPTQRRRAVAASETANTPPTGAYPASGLARQLAVAERKPAESGEQPAAQPFQHGPRSGGGDRALPRARRRPARAEPAGRGRKEREVRAKARGANGGHRQGHSAERVERDVDPRHAGAEQPEAESEPEPDRKARRLRVLPQQHEKREHDDRDERNAERREAEHRGGAGQKRELRPQRRQERHRACTASPHRRNVPRMPVNAPPEA